MPILLSRMATIPLEDNFTDIIGKAQRGFNLTDDQLAQRAAVSVHELGRIQSGKLDLESLQREFPEYLSNARGKGLMCAFDFKDTALRDKVIAAAYEEGVVVIASGPASIRFRPPLVVTKEAIAEGLEKLRTSVRKSIG